VGDAEALLFVHDQETEIGEMDVLGKKAMRADNHVHFAGFEIGEDSFLFGGVRKRLSIFNARGKWGEAALEGLEVLERKDGGGARTATCFPSATALNAAAHRDFRFAVADIATEERSWEFRVMSRLISATAAF